MHTVTRRTVWIHTPFVALETSEVNRHGVHQENLLQIL